MLHAFYKYHLYLLPLLVVLYYNSRLISYNYSLECERERDFMSYHCNNDYVRLKFFYSNQYCEHRKFLEREYGIPYECPYVILHLKGSIIDSDGNNMDIDEHKMVTPIHDIKKVNVQRKQFYIHNIKLFDYIAMKDFYETIKNIKLFDFTVIKDFHETLGFVIIDMHYVLKFLCGLLGTLFLYIIYLFALKN